MLPERDAALLAGELAGNGEQPAGLSRSDQEVLTEVGNILLSACLGTFGNVLQMRFTFNVPRVSLESLTHLLESLRFGAEGLHYGPAITTHFRVRKTEIVGHLVVVMGLSSLDRLLGAVEGLGEPR